MSGGSVRYPSVNALFDSRVKEFPNQGFLGAADDSLNYRLFTYQEVDRAADAVAAHFVQSGIKPRSPNDHENRLCVSLLMPSGIDYFIIELAIVRLGLCAVFLSINNSVPALAHLLQATKSSAIITSPALTPLAEEAIEKLHEAGHPRPAVVQRPRDSIWLDAVDGKTETVPRMERPLSYEEEAPLPAFVVHSSGSTSFPKAIFLTHSASVHNFASSYPYHAFLTLPIFHNHGHSAAWRAVDACKVLWMYPTHLPLTTASILAALRHPSIPPELKVQIFWGVPWVIKLLSESKAGVDALRQLQLVTFGGSPCPDEVGNELVAKGVRFAAHYGLTEVGGLMSSIHRDFDSDKGWDWLFMPSKLKEYSYWEPYSKAQDHWELIIKAGWPGKVMSNRENGDYATSDLFRRHPHIEDRWKFVGRKDDTIILINGEKTNPMPIELAIRGGSSLVSDAVVFGEGRAQNGVLLFLSQETAGLDDSFILDSTWPAVEVANSAAPTHSQILREMVVLVPYGTTLPQADKGSLIRRHVATQFKPLIDQVYNDFESGNQAGAVKQSLNLEETTQFVKGVVAKTLGRASNNEPGIDEDLFSAGVNSLHCARIRNVLQRDLELGGKKLPSNVVYEQASIEKLARFLVDLRDGVALHHGTEIDTMLSLKAKYIESLGVKSGVKHNAPTYLRTVVLTGATGSLGAHILSQLRECENIEHVFCLSRGKDDSDALARVSQSLEARGLMREGLLDKVTVFASDFSDPRLGLSQERYIKVEGSATDIVHSAWAVNFNLPVRSFEAYHISGVCNLIRLASRCASGSARFFFVSSVSAVAAYTGGEVVHESVSTSPSDAQAMGYARSKWVAEAICEAAASKLDMGVTVFRTGQLIGDSDKGIWNETEAIPLQIRSAETTGCLPNLDENVSWLPVNYAAKAIIEGLQNQGPSLLRVLHIVNPAPQPWKRVLDSLSESGVQFETVPTPIWLERLAASDPDPISNPSIKLLDFFASKYRDPTSVSKRAKLGLETTLRHVPVLADVPRIEDGLLKRIVQHWRKTGFLR